ncbi:MAG TPA: hypothetical protein VK272_08615 [Solirubrobacteraceae bacterium]|nr:hypothetical protein [Solirubrobacteraceae bacterium]
MLGERGDVHAAVIVTNAMLLRSPEAVVAHRKRQLDKAEAALKRAETDAGRERGARACRLLAGEKVGKGSLDNAGYVRAAMVPRAAIAALQYAFCFYAGDEWRPEMAGFRLVIDKDTSAMVKYVGETLLPVLGGDERFRLVTPSHWREPDPHPLLVSARHPDGDGYAPQLLLGDTIDWPDSCDEPGIQVADMAAWIVCRAISRPQETIARSCFELMRPVLVGGAGRCFQYFSIGDVRPEDEALDAYLHSDRPPDQWLV